MYQKPRSPPLTAQEVQENCQIREPKASTQVYRAGSQGELGPPGMSQEPRTRKRRPPRSVSGIQTRRHREVEQRRAFPVSTLPRGPRALTPRDHCSHDKHVQRTLRKRTFSTPTFEGLYSHPHRQGVLIIDRICRRASDNRAAIKPARRGGNPKYAERLKRKPRTT